MTTIPTERVRELRDEIDRYGTGSLHAGSELVAILDDYLTRRDAEARELKPIVPQWCPYCQQPHGVQAELPKGEWVPVVPVPNVTGEK